MAKQDDGEWVRRRVAQLGPRGRTTRIADDVRHEIVAFARQQRAAGQSWRAIAQGVGVSLESVRRWSAAARLATRPVPTAVVPVQVRAEVDGRGVVLVAPNGYRVEGLSVADAGGLLRMLA